MALPEYDMKDPVDHSKPSEEEFEQYVKAGERPAVEPAVSESAYADPLSPITRAERRTLLIADVVLLAFVWGSLVPTKIEVLGLAFSSSQRGALVTILFAVNLYLAIAFWLYSRVDDRVWLVRYIEVESAIWRMVASAEHAPAEDREILVGGGRLFETPKPAGIEPDAFWRAWKLSQIVYYERKWFDVRLPLILTALVWLGCLAKLLFMGL